MLLEWIFGVFGLWQMRGVTPFTLRYFTIVESNPDGALCALQPASEVVLSETVLDCALYCQRFAYCNNFNYNCFDDTCDIFFEQPTCYGKITGCIHYQTQTVQQLHAETTSQYCSLPFTYEGNLYNSCARNLTGCSGCLLRNRTVVMCKAPQLDVSDPYVVRNLTIPNIVTETPVLFFNDWIVIQLKLNTSKDFNRNWIDYKVGFGSLNSSFWLGLERIYQMTNNADYRLRVELQSAIDGKWFSAEYNVFSLSHENLNYTLTIMYYEGDAGDAFTSHSGRMFATYDQDTSGLCAHSYKAGWWYKLTTCSRCNLNGSNFWGSLPTCPSFCYVSISRMMIKLN